MKSITPCFQAIYVQYDMAIHELLAVGEVLPVYNIFPSLPLVAGGAMAPGGIGGALGTWSTEMPKIISPS